MVSMTFVFRHDATSRFANPNSQSQNLIRNFDNPVSSKNELAMKIIEKDIEKR